MMEGTDVLYQYVNQCGLGVFLSTISDEPRQGLIVVPPVTDVPPTRLPTVSSNSGLPTREPWTPQPILRTTRNMFVGKPCSVVRLGRINLSDTLQRQIPWLYRPTLTT